MAGDDLLSVGQVARRVGLTTKALRHYDRIGLFVPDVVDAAGYRWYAPARLDAARVIGRLRSIDVPLAEVRACLSSEDPRTVHDVLVAHQLRLEARLIRLRGDLHAVSHLLTDEGVPAVSDEPELLDHRRLGAALFNGVWDLMGKEDRSRDDDDRMLHMAHASRHHWGFVGTPAHLARGEWQCSRVYALLRRPEPSLHHAQRVLDLCTENSIADWDLAFAYEALARGHAVAGDAAAARSSTEAALAVEIIEDDDRALLLGDLETIPGQERFW